MIAFYESRDERLFIGEMTKYPFPLHVHELAEIIGVTAGFARISINGTEYTLNPGDVAVVFPLTPHSYDEIGENASGQVAIAVLPEPLLTVARSQNPDLVVALDLTAEWDKVAQPGSLVQGCVVVRTDFAAEHPAELARFLEEYGASVAFLEEDPAAAGQMIEAAGIFAKAAVAEKAIPRCNLCFITGEQMQAQLAAFLQIMGETAPNSIGGQIPGDDFYCILK